MKLVLKHITSRGGLVVALMAMLRYGGALTLAKKTASGGRGALCALAMAGVMVAGGMGLASDAQAQRPELQITLDDDRHYTEGETVNITVSTTNGSALTSRLRDVVVLVRHDGTNPDSANTADEFIRFRAIDGLVDGNLASNSLGSFIMNSGESAITFTLTSTNDAYDEESSTVSVYLIDDGDGNPSGLPSRIPLINYDVDPARRKVLVTIADDDPAFALRTNNTSLAAGGELDLTVFVESARGPSTPARRRPDDTVYLRYTDGEGNVIPNLQPTSVVVKGDVVDGSNVAQQKDRVDFTVDTTLAQAGTVNVEIITNSGPGSNKSLPFTAYRLSQNNALPSSTSLTISDGPVFAVSAPPLTQHLYENAGSYEFTSAVTNNVPVPADIPMDFCVTHSGGAIGDRVFIFADDRVTSFSLPIIHNNINCDTFDSVPRGTRNITARLQFTTDDVNEASANITFVHVATDRYDVNATANTASVLVHDNDPSFSISPRSPSVMGGDEAEFVITTTQALTVDKTIYFEISGDEVFNRNFALGETPTNVTMQANTRSTSFSVPTLTSTAADAMNGTLNARLIHYSDINDPVTPYRIDFTNTRGANLTVVPAPPPNLSITRLTPITGREGDTVQFRVETANGSALGRDITINLNLAQNGGNMFVTGTSFHLSNETSSSRAFTVPHRNNNVGFFANLTHDQTGVTITVPSDNDELDEVSGTLVLGIRDGIGYTFPSDAGIGQAVTLLDDDPIYDMQVDRTTAFTGDDIVFTIRSLGGGDVVVDQIITYSISDPDHVLAEGSGELITKRFYSGSFLSVNAKVRNRTALGGRTGTVTARVISDIDNLNASTPYRATNTTLNVSVYPTPPELSVELAEVIPSRIHEGQRILLFNGNISPDTPVDRPTDIRFRISQPGNLITAYGFAVDGTGFPITRSWDYSRQGNSDNLTFPSPLPAGTTSFSISVTTINDDVDDISGNITVELLPSADNPGIDYVIAPGKAKASVFVVDDDPLVAIRVPDLDRAGRPIANTTRVTAGENVTVTLRTSSTLVADNVVQLEYTGHEDFLADTIPTNVTIPAGSLGVSFNITTRPNPPRRGTFNISVASHRNLTDPITPYMVDPTNHTVSVYVHTPPQLVLEFVDAARDGVSRDDAIDEGDPVPELRVRTADGLTFGEEIWFNILVNQTNVPLAEKLQVSFINEAGNSVMRPTTSSTSQFDVYPVTAAADDTLVRIQPDNIFPANNTIDSPSQLTFAFELRPGEGYGIIAAQDRLSYRIIDNDPPIGIRATPDYIRLGESMNLTLFVEDETTPLNIDNTVRVRFHGAEGIITGADRSERVTMAAGATSTDFSVATNAGGAAEDTISVITAEVITNPGRPPITPYSKASDGRDTAQVIVVGSNAPAVSIADATASENVTGGVLRFPVTLSRPVNGTLTIEYEVVDGTASGGGVDYNTPATRLVLPEGETQGVINVTLTDDEILELDETLTVRLLSITQRTLAVLDSTKAEATGTIIDNEPPPIISIANTTANEGDGNATFTITLTPAPVHPLSFAIATSGGLPEARRATHPDDGNATHPADFSDRNERITIAAGTTSLRLNVTLVDDEADEDDQTFTLTLSTPINASFAGGAATLNATATIIDNDPQAIMQIMARQNGSEAGEVPILFDLISDRIIELPLTTIVAIGGGSATAGKDYTTTRFSFTDRYSVSRHNPVTFSVAVVDDSMDEVNETVVARINSTFNADFDRDSDSNSATATIVDNDAPPALGFDGGAPRTIAERRTEEFTITLNTTSGKTITFDYATIPGTATSGIDYGAVSGTARIPAGNTNFNLTIEALRDTISDEEDETFSLVISNPKNASFAGGAETITLPITIINAPLPTLSVSNASATEGNRIIFQPQLDITWDREMSVSYRLVAETATAAIPSTPNDYNPRPRERLSGDAILCTPPDILSVNICRITISAGSRTLPLIEVITTDDRLDEEENETLVLEFFDATNIVLGANSNATGTIFDDDSPPEYSVRASNSPVREGETAIFTITLNTTSGRNVSVAYATRDETAVAGTDYTETTGTVNIPAGSLTGEVQVPVLTDGLDENIETFALRLGVATNALPPETGGTSAAAVITDIDPQPTVTIASPPSPVNEGENATFTITLNTPSGKNVRVAYATRDGSATGTTTGGDADYTAIIAGTAIIPAGSLNVTVNVTTLADSLDEANEEFTLRLTTAINATISTASDTATATAIIADTDDAPSLTLTPPADAVDEGDAAVFTITLSTASGKNISVAYATSDGTAKAGTLPDGDYTATTGTLTIMAGETTGEIQVATLPDSLDEDNEDFTLRISTPDNATITGGGGGGTASAIATIADINPPPSLTITASNSPVVEGEVAVFTVTLSTASGKNISVEYATNDTGNATAGNATAGLDYTTTTGTLIIPAGEMSGEVRVATLPDTLDEGEESVVVAITNPINATLASPPDNSATAIIDDVPIGRIRIAPSASVNETARQVTLTITLQPPQNDTVTVIATTIAGSATSGEDYTPTSRRLITFPVNQTEETLTLAISDDTLDEVAETFTLRLSELDAGGTRTQLAGGGETLDSEVTILDNDNPPSVSVTPPANNVAEGGEAVFTITLNTTSGKNISITYATRDGTANGTASGGGEDYVATTGTAIIPAGNTNYNVTIMALNDNLDEADETFALGLVAADNATIDPASNSATATIADTDDPPRVSVSTTATPVREGEVAVFTITLNTPSGKNVSVDYATSDGTANGTASGGGGDYEVTTGTAIIPAGSLTGEVNVATRTDSLDEDNETFILRLTGAENATIASDATNSTTATIEDINLPPTLTISTNATGDSPTQEGTEAVFTIRLNTPSGKNISVTYATEDGTATAGEDYTAITAGTITIPVGETSAQVQVQTRTDLLDEDNETFTLRLTTAINATIASDATNTTTATIEDINAPPTISVSTNATSDNPTQEGTEAVFTITLGAISGKNISVTYATEDGSATGTTTGADADYTTNAGILIIPAGATSGEVRVTTTDDSLDEDNEDFTLRISNPDNATIAGGTASTIATIADNDDPPTISIAPPTLPVAEGDEAVFIITLSPASGKNVAVDYATNDTGNATAGSDYTTTAGTLTIMAGETSGEVQVQTLNDTIDEADEDFVMRLTNPVNATINTASDSAIATISDIPIGRIRIAPSASVNETAGQVILNITLQPPQESVVTVRAATIDGSATSLADYTVFSDTISFGVGDTQHNLTLNITDDTLDEGAETFTLRLSDLNAGSTRTQLAGGGATLESEVTILDNDNPPMVSVSAPTSNVDEGGEAVFTIRLDAPSGKNISVDYATSDGTANTSDYTMTTGTLIIPVGETSSTVNVTTLADNLDEADETFTLRLTDADNATIATASDSATATIADTDDPPRVSVSTTATPVREGEVAVFTIALDVPSGKNVSVSYMTEDGTATAASDDYTAITAGTITIPVGETEAQVQVQTRTDLLDEDNETFILRLTGAENATIASDATNSTTATIEDINAPPSVSVSTTATPVREGEVAVFTITLNTPSGKNISVEYETRDGSAIAPSDYTAITAGTLIIPAGSLTGEVRVATRTDLLDEDNETFILRLVAAENATIASDATNTTTATIEDINLPPTLTITTNATSDNPTQEGTEAVFTITLNTPSGKNVSVTYETLDGTATAASDYTAITAGTVIIMAGEMSGEVQVQTRTDTLDEDNETFALRLTGAENATIATASDSATATIADTNAPPSLTLTTNATPTQEGTAAVFTITLNTPSGKNISVDYATSDGSAIAPSDYTTNAGTLTIMAGEMSGTVPVTTLADNLDEDNEDFTLRISNPDNATITGGGGTASVMATIADNDDPPTISITPPADPTAEGDMAVFIIRLDNPSGKNVAVNYATNDTGNATVGLDYNATSGTLTIMAGATEGMVRVPILQDELDEGEESVVVAITNPVNATLASPPDNSATAIISDIRVGRISIAPLTTSVTEGATATITLTLDPPQNDTVRLRADTIAGTATEGSDYTAITNRLITFGAGVTTQTINISTSNDSLDEVAETFILRLSDLNAGRTRTRLTDTEAVITITDNDDAPIVRVMPPPNPVNEGGEAVFTIRLDAPSGKNISVDYATRDGSATAGNDYTPITTGTLIIPVGETSSTVNVTTLADALDEADETFTLRLTAANNATLPTAPSDSATATIADINDAPSLTITTNATSATPTQEGTGAWFTIALNATSGRNVSVTYATEDGSATGTTSGADADYTTTTGTLTITAGNRSNRTWVPVLNDALDEDNEDFVLRLTNPMNATIATDSASASIADTDDPPTIIIPPISAGNEGSALSFNVTLSPVSGKQVSVDYATSIEAGDNATSGVDFTATSGTLVFAPGVERLAIAVPTALDLEIEDNETFTLTLSQPQNVNFAGNATSIQVTGVIVDAGVPLLSVADAVATEGEDLVFRLSLSNPWIAPVAVDYATEAGTAVAGVDYADRRGRVTIPARATEAVVRVPTISDDLDEAANETMRLVLSRVENAIITGNATGTIRDDDGLPQLVLVGRNVIEGRVASIIIQARGSRPIVDLAVAVMISNSTSINASEAGVRNVTFVAEGRQALLEIATNDNNLTQANPPITISLLPTSVAAGYALGTPASIEIQVLDDESVSDIGDMANEAVLPQLMAYMTQRTTNVIGGRILRVLRFNPDNLPQVGGIPYGGRQFVIDGQSLTGLAAREARREAAEHPWDSPTSQSRLREVYDVYDLRFALPFAGSFADRFSIWGEGQYSEVSGTDNGIEYDGEIPGFVLGLDTRVSNTTIIGFSISQINSDFTVATTNATNTTRARHQTDITTLHPYVGWLFGDALRVWLAAGFGDGDIRITSPDIDFDVETSVGLRLYSFGFDRALSTRGDIAGGGQVTTYATGDIAIAELEVDAATDADGLQSIRGQTLTTSTSRLAYTVRRMRQMASGIVTQQVDTIFRYDRGDAIRGAGLEIGGSLALSLNSGLHFNLSGRALLAHTGAADTDWGISGGIRYSAQRGIGLSFAFVPEWGSPDSRGEAVWEADLAGLTNSAGSDGGGLRYRLDVRYGISLFDQQAVLTPFATRHANQNVNLGADFTLGRHFSAGYELLLPQSEEEASENSLSINYDRRF